MSIACQFIRFVVVEKNHPVSHYSMSFWMDSSLLDRKLISKLNRRVPLIIINAMCTVSIKAAFELDIRVKISFDHWPAVIKTMHQKVALDYQCTIQPELMVTNTIKTDLQDDALLPNQVIV